jgi:hypothetical protein
MRKGVKTTIIIIYKMSYHFGKNEYNRYIGEQLGDFIIIDIEYRPDSVYMMTDGQAGKPHFMTLSNGDTFQFRHFEEVIMKYGHLKCNKCEKN